jgi:hypothetical protein
MKIENPGMAIRIIEYQICHLTSYLCDESLQFETRIMRKTSDLVNEMLAEAKKTFLVAIAVGFTTETKFVFSSAKFPLKDLNTLVQRGGSPIGLLRFEKENSIIQGSYRPFFEYEKEEWVGKYLADLLENTPDIMVLSQQPDVMDY